MISIGLLLGMSAAKRGSMDLLATKKISTQLEALLPPTATDLPLSHTTQVAGKHYACHHQLFVYIFLLYINFKNT